jgi:hypothetical protein
MFGWLFGKKKKHGAQEEPDPADAAEQAADEAFGKAKEEALERVLGPMDDTVFHAIIPFFIGGTLDLYTFSKCIPGTAFVTQELIVRLKEDRPKPGRTGYFELVACLPPGVSREDEEGLSLIQSVLDPIARYASMAALNPNETAEIPQEDGEPTLPIIFDRFTPPPPGNGDLDFAGEKCHLLLCIAVHHSELAFARNNGGAELIAKLKAAKAYPYSDLKRKAAV